MLMTSDGFVAYYEMGIDQVREFDAHIEVYGGNQHIKIQYDSYVASYLQPDAAMLLFETVYYFTLPNRYNFQSRPPLEPELTRAS
jgi:hypothetical protein